MTREPLNRPREIGHSASNYETGMQNVTIQGDASCAGGCAEDKPFGVTGRPVSELTPAEKFLVLRPRTAYAFFLPIQRPNRPRKYSGRYQGNARASHRSNQAIIHRSRMYRSGLNRKSENFAQVKGLYAPQLRLEDSAIRGNLWFDYRPNSCEFCHFAIGKLLQVGEPEVAVRL